MLIGVDLVSVIETSVTVTECIVSAVDVVESRIAMPGAVAFEFWPQFREVEYLNMGEK